MTEALFEETRAAASQLVADQAMLRRTLNVKVPLIDADLIPLEEAGEHRYLRLNAG